MAMIEVSTRKPRLGFLGLGRIGRDRLQALVAGDSARIVALADPDPASLAEARLMAPSACCCPNLKTLLQQNLDGLVIATPNALHHEQALAALRAGVAVFCQKPLTPTARQSREVVACARQQDRLLGVDLSYRHLHGMQRIKQLAQAGELGRVYALSLAFHNAFGP